jgi:hypothetical protein
VAAEEWRSLEAGERMGWSGNTRSEGRTYRGRQVREELGEGAERPAGEPASWLGRKTPVAGSELASYRISSGDRVLICALGKSGLEIVDIAADLLGQSYRVDRVLEDDDALWAVVDDYLAQADRLDAPPMSDEAMTAMFRPSTD